MIDLITLIMLKKLEPEPRRTQFVGSLKKRAKIRGYGEKWIARPTPWFWW
jgi:hypothetical protein